MTTETGAMMSTERAVDQIALAEAVDASGLTERLFVSGMLEAAHVLEREAQRFDSTNVAEASVGQSLLRGARLIRSKAAAMTTEPTEREPSRIPQGWIYEDQLPDSISQPDYNKWYSKSRVIDGVRMGPSVRGEAEGLARPRV